MKSGHPFRGRPVGGMRLPSKCAPTSPITTDRSDRLSQPLSSRGRQADASRTAVPGGEDTDGPAVADLIQRREQIADNERMTKGHVRCYRADDQAARDVQSLQLMQVTFLIDRRRISNAQPREAERFGPLGHATRLDGAAREYHDSVVDAISHGEPRKLTTPQPFQWMAAYMIFSSVASNAENSSTTLPMRHTRMRSESAITSGRYDEMTTTALPSSASRLMSW